MLLTVVAELFAGCVKDKIGICYSGLKLRYHYTLNPQDTNAFGPDINELTIHVFDSRGMFYEEFVFDDPADLAEDHVIFLPLPDGKWDIVTWGSEGKGALTNSYDMGILSSDSSGPIYSQGIEKGQTNIEEARLWIKNHAEHEDGRRHVTDKLSRLYYAGIYSVTTTTGVNPVNIVDVPMMQNTNTLRIIINGLPQVTTRAASKDFTVTADMINGHYRHNNLLCSDGLPLKYENGEWVDGEDGLQYDLTVLRPFMDDNVSELKIRLPGFTIPGTGNGEIALPIIPTIMQSPDYNNQTDLDRSNLYIFEFNFDSDLNFTVTVNGWKIVNVTPEI